MVKKKVIAIIAIPVSLVIGCLLYPPLFGFISGFINFICNDFTLGVYIILIIVMCVGGNTYGAGYSLLRRKYLLGTFIWMTGALILLGFMLTALHYTGLVLIFNTSIEPTLKFILIIMYALLILPYLVLSIEKWMDLSTYFKDIWNHREEYRMLTYKVEEKGKLVYIHLDKHGTKVTNFHEPAPTLKIQEIFLTIRKNPDESLALYLKSAFLFIVTEIVRLFTAWPTTRNRILRKFAKIKMGKDVCIAQFSRMDPLFPDLIEFEDGSGCGIGCNFLTHNFMQKDPLSICIGPIKVGKNARIGAHSVILPGVTIGEGALIGAGSVVTCDVPPYTIVMGVPAKVVKKIECNADGVISNEGDECLDQ